jgi:hypothetical protein
MKHVETNQVYEFRQISINNNEKCIGQAANRLQLILQTKLSKAQIESGTDRNLQRLHTHHYIRVNVTDTAHDIILLGLLLLVNQVSV